MKNHTSVVRRKIFLRLAWVLGVLIFAYLLYRIGPARIWENIQKLTWRNFLIIFVLRFVSWMARAFNWKIVHGCYERSVSYPNLLASRLAGYAFGYLTPSAYIGSEAVRVLTLASSNKRKTLASVIVDTWVEVMTVGLFAVVGILIAVSQLTLADSSKIILFLSILGIVFFIIFFFVRQKRGLLIWIADGLGKIKVGVKFIARYREKIKETDAYIADFYTRHRQTFCLVLFLYLLIHLFWVAEIHLTLVFLGASGVTFLKSFLIVSFGALGFLLPVTPAALGTYEVTYLAIFSLLGLGADLSLSLTIVRRALALFWVGVGLLMIARRPRKSLY